MKTKLILLVLLFVQLAFSQQRTCGTMEMHEQAMANPEFVQQRTEMLQKVNAELLRMQSSSFRQPNVTIRIPVAIHFPAGSEVNRACLEDLAQNQVNILNNDYSGTNTDATNWDPSWSNVGGIYPGTVPSGLDIVFEIATKNHPAVSGRVDGQKLVTIGSNRSNFLPSANGDYDPNYAGYINFVVRNIPGNVLGFSPLGGQPTNGYAVVINRSAFGTGSGCPVGFTPGAPYNLGRTLTHELGHFLNLNHPFISASGSASDCTPDDADGIDDTPKQAAATYGNPAPGSISSCDVDKQVLSTNYMDYTNDAGMYMFTVRQIQVSQAFYNVIAADLKQNVLSVDPLTFNGFDIYPNPIKNNLNIDLKESAQDLKLNIVDISRRTIFNKQYSNVLNIQIDNINATTGIYFVSINADGKTFTKKVIVE